MNKRKNKLLKIGSLLSVLTLCGCSYIQPLEKHAIKPKRAIDNEYYYIQTNNYTKTSVDIFDLYFSSDTGDFPSLEIRTNDNTNLWSEKTYSLSNYSNYIGVRVYLISNVFTPVINNYNQGIYIVPFALGDETISSMKLYFDNGYQFNNGIMTYTGFANPIEYRIKYTPKNSYVYNSQVLMDYEENYVSFDSAIGFIKSDTACQTFTLTKALYNVLNDETAVATAYENGYNVGYNSGLQTNYDNGYSDGFSNGQESGKAIGRNETIQNTYQGKTYQQIYNIGYSDGETATSGTTTLIPSLFGAIVNIPISILNGLVPLTFFDISIIRVALTFLALGVVMWIIRKVLI